MRHAEPYPGGTGMKFLAALVDFSFIAAYFALADYVGPKLVQSGRAWLWWLILVALMSGFYVSVRWSPISRRARANTKAAIEAVAFALLLCTLFLYDFSIRPVLDRYGFGNAWIVGLLMTLLTVVLGTWKSRREEKGPNVRSL